ncbi:MAG: 2-hydroxyacid dehydrogenase [Planktomarina sp.]
MTDLGLKLLITRPLPEPVLVKARAHFADVTVRGSNVPLTAQDARQAMQAYDAILPTLGDDFSATAFEGGSFACKVLANFGVGYNHIDVAAAQSAGITVSNTPGAVTDATADIALMLMLMSLRRASEGEAMVRAGAWDGWHPTQLLGLHMTGKTVGIIGMGRIGQAIATRCRLGFGMQVIYANRSPKPVEGCTQVADLAALLIQADVVVLAVPGGAATRHLMGVAEFAQMQPHAHLINISRGDVVDEAALIAALRSGQIAGAGLDVYEREPNVPQALRDMANVTLLPHLGTATLEVRTDMGLMAVDNLIAFAQNGRVLNPAT